MTTANGSLEQLRMPSSTGADARIRVAYLTRRPRAEGTFSVELLTEQLVANLSNVFDWRVAVSRFESSGLWRRVFNIFEAASVRADILHVMGDVTYLTFLLNRRKTVLTILDCGVISGKPTLRKRVIKLLWYRIPIMRSNQITVISHDVKQQLLRHVSVDPSKVHVVHVAVPSIYRRLPKVFNTEQPVILQIGAGAHKNRERLIHAVAGVPCRLVLIGRLSEQERELLERLEISYQNLRNLSAKEMLDAYRQADLLAFPSTYEGFGMPIVEANIVGRPVVTGNVTSMPEVAGDAACLVDPFDVKSIRAGIMKVIGDATYREHLVELGYQNAKRFDASNIAREYEKVYQAMMQANG